MDKGTKNLIVALRSYAAQYKVDSTLGRLIECTEELMADAADKLDTLDKELARMNSQIARWAQVCEAQNKYIDELKEGRDARKESTTRIALDKLGRSVIPQLDPCDLCRYSPPSSGSGKPCSMCSAAPRELENG